MDLGLKGRVAVVSAASRGLGKAVAMGLAAEGANLAICSHNEAAIQAAAEEIRAKTGASVVPVAADVSRAEDIERFVQRAEAEYGRVDILFSNTGGPPPGTFEQVGDAEWERAYQLIQLSAVRLTRAVLPAMRRQKWGRIVYSTSISVMQPIDNLILSNSLRSAVLLMAKTVKDDVARDNILVNVVCPGRIYTERIVQLDRDRAQRGGLSVEQVERNAVASIPLGRSGTPEEFANVVVFLASDAASYLSGTVIQVDGGQYRGVF
ncbi:MAG TPA: SDR family oxidoreductase [Chloroflexota bacterium]|nr:SDR family oxidoreductase [Chloroflexota bacterium]